jgi:hypothetical protein
MTTIDVLLTDVTKEPDNVNTKKLFVMIKTHVPLTTVVLLKDVTLNQSLVMTKMHVPLILVIQSKDAKTHL